MGLARRPRKKIRGLRSGSRLDRSTRQKRGRRPPSCVDHQFDSHPNQVLRTEIVDVAVAETGAETMKSVFAAFLLIAALVNAGAYTRWAHASDDVSRLIQQLHDPDVQRRRDAA